MIMRGDMNKIIEEVNVHLEKVYKRVELLEDRVKTLEKPPSAKAKASPATKTS